MFIFYPSLKALQELLLDEKQNMSVCSEIYRREKKSRKRLQRKKEGKMTLQ